jgi:hypothetical protein
MKERMQKGVSSVRDQDDEFMLDYTSAIYVLRSVDSPLSAARLLSESNAFHNDKSGNFRVYIFVAITLHHYGSPSTLILIPSRVAAIVQPPKNFSAFYGTRRFITAFIHLPPSTGPYPVPD